MNNGMSVLNILCPLNALGTNVLTFGLLFSTTKINRSNSIS